MPPFVSFVQFLITEESYQLLVYNKNLISSDGQAVKSAHLSLWLLDIRNFTILFTHSQFFQNPVFDRATDLPFDAALRRRYSRLLRKLPAQLGNAEEFFPAEADGKAGNPSLRVLLTRRAARRRRTLRAALATGRLTCRGRLLGSFRCRFCGVDLLFCQVAVIKK